MRPRDRGRVVDVPVFVRQTEHLMVVCHCNVVHDREIRAEILAGALDADDLAARCTAGTRCGGCKPVLEALIAETRVSIGHALSAA